MDTLTTHMTYRHAEVANYQPQYNISWALVVGINTYHNMPPLNNAVKDAHDVANLLINTHQFPPNNVITLTDEMATRDNILAVFDTIINPFTVSPDDRVFIFFAGHGITRKKQGGGGVGYIAPINAQPRAWRTLIEMSGLIDQARFLPAKHILFVMDACYSGLSFQRNVTFDTLASHFLTRRAVQVITAGRQDEAVADGGDPDGNSAFTGYLLDALSGKAATASSLMTASDVMQYVSRNVLGRHDINQTPQYGWIEGDGDFVFSLPQGKSLPPKLEVALRQGSTPARMMALNQLTDIIRGDDIQLVEIAMTRLTEVAECDPDPRISNTALRMLGIDASAFMVEVEETRQRPVLPETVVGEPLPAPSKGIVRRIWGGELAPALIALSLFLCIGLGVVAGGVVLRGRAAGAAQGDDVTSEPTTDQSGTLPTQTSDALSEPPPTGPDLESQPSLIPESDQPAPTALPALPLFVDDFSVINNLWEAFPDEIRDNASVEVNRGEMLFNVLGTYALWFANPDDLWVRDGFLSVDVRVKSLQTGGSYGLVFRQIDTSQYYYYHINSDGTFSLTLHESDGAVRDIVQATNLNSPPALDEVHTLGVEYIGTTFILSYNGQLIASITSATLASGRVGVGVETALYTPTSVIFDNFVVEDR